MKVPVVISLRKLLPIWAIPNGGFVRANCRTFLKLMKMPGAGSGRREAVEAESSTCPTWVLNMRSNRRASVSSQAIDRHHSPLTLLRSRTPTTAKRSTCSRSPGFDAVGSPRLCATSTRADRLARASDRGCRRPALPPAAPGCCYWLGSRRPRDRRSFAPGSAPRNRRHQLCRSQQPPPPCRLAPSCASSLGGRAN